MENLALRMRARHGHECDPRGVGPRPTGAMALGAPLAGLAVAISIAMLHLWGHPALRRHDSPVEETGFEPPVPGREGWVPLAEWEPSQRRQQAVETVPLS
jgi:hypothetical protein